MPKSEILLTDIAEVERVKKGTIYPAGTVYIQVSACNHNNSERFHILREESELETKYAVILPRVQCIPEYLRNNLEFHSTAFFDRYVGTNINIQMDSFKSFRLVWHESIEEQKEFCKTLNELDMLMEMERQTIEGMKQFKGYMLANMFPA